MIKLLTLCVAVLVVISVIRLYGDVRERDGWNQCVSVSAQ
jgi:hypothetical protein